MIYFGILYFGISMFLSIRKISILAKNEAFWQNCFYAVIYCIAWYIPLYFSGLALPHKLKSDFDIMCIIPPLTVLVSFVYCWVKLGEYYPNFYLPGYMLMLLCTLGIMVFMIDQKVFTNNSNNTNTDSNNQTFVDPHQVDGYTKEDGTQVKSYWRDGDGNTNIDLTKEQGGGYYRKN